jgi:hypothetical protein
VCEKTTDSPASAVGRFADHTDPEKRPEQAEIVQPALADCGKARKLLWEFHT